MLTHPQVYYVDRGNDVLQHVFCWSLSEYKGSGLNFIWRVCWSFHSEPTLALCQRFQEHKSYPVKLNGYVFDASSPDCRAMWRETKPPTIFSPSLADVVLHPSIQLDWFGSSSLGSTISLPPQPPIPAPSDYTYHPTDNLVQGLSGLYVNPVDTSLSPEPVPSSQCSDTSSDISIDACSPENFEAEPAQSPKAYFSEDTRGNIILNVPRTLENRDAVDSFLGQALPQLDKRVRRIKCSLCKNKKADRKWGVKPSNLQRHILAHLGIKDHHCLRFGCGETFTTKDQMIKHMKKKHPALAKWWESTQKKRGDGNRGAKNENVAQDTYASSSSAGIAVSAGEAGPWLNDQTGQTLLAQFTIPLDDKRSFF
ncbi:hypothetical protein RSOLAG22IIIB_12206 [Rhizoctonia solani]|uniref:C2H2-type domain-containing protein n=1 Tax=Rhizoctonia solani TaxID=456999 RepID=A0A0K6GCW0_9AGAM|nr:hypothetical protein RSOLAG22IIIB_12206 [Rhizoctonia solani]